MAFLLYFGVKTIWYLHSHFVCARFCSFAIQKHLFDCGRELEQLRLIEKVFFMFNFFGIHPLSGWFTVSVASSLNCLKALIKKKGPVKVPSFIVMY